MVSLDAFAPEVKGYFTNYKFEPCTSQRPLMSIEQNFEADTVRLLLHEDLRPEYSTNSSNGLNCSYQEIFRDGDGDSVDWHFK